MSPRRRGARVTIEPGIYRDARGYETVARVGTTRQKARRWPLGTDLAEMRAWLDDTRAALRRVAPDAGTRGTLRADVARYIDQVKTLASWRELRAELRAWIALYGHLPRRSITPAQIRQAQVRWTQAGVAPRTVNHRCDALRRMWRTLDGRPGLPPPPCPARSCRAWRA